MGLDKTLIKMPHLSQRKFDHVTSVGDYQHPISCDSEILNLDGGQNTLNKHHMSRMSLVGYSKAVL